jgi:hypothetical protein
VAWGAAGCSCTPGNPAIGVASATAGVTGGAGNTSAATSYAGGGGGGGWYGGGGGAGSTNIQWSIGGGGGTSYYQPYSNNGVTFTGGYITGLIVNNSKERLNNVNAGFVRINW